MTGFWSNLRNANLWNLSAGLILVVGLFSSLFWNPAPNRVQVPVLGNPEPTVLQVYYRYGFPGPGSFYEYYSDKELLHKTDSDLVAEFELPGWQSLRAIRLDLGSEERSFDLGTVVFGYEWAYRFYPLFRLDADALRSQWEPNDQIGEVTVTPEGLSVESTGKDAYVILPIAKELWKGALPGGVLWQLRGVRMLLYALLAGVVFLIGRLVRSGWIRKAGTSETPCWNRFWIVPWGLGIAGLGFVVYEPYLVFQKLYLFKDVATDSVDVFWPIYMHISDYFRTEGYPLWSFSIGAGQGLFNWIGDPFLAVLFMIPSSEIGFALGWMQFCKTIVAAFFFLGWLRLLGIGRFAATIAVVGLVFSAHMVIRGNWTHYATEVVMVAFALFAFECFLRKKIWQLLPLAILFLVVRGVYHTYVWSLLFFGYALLRLWMDAGWKPKWIGSRVLQLAGCYCLGIGLSAFFLLPNLAELFSSPRVTGSESSISAFAHSEFFAINEPEEWLSSLYGWFAPDLLGRGSFYSGWRNYLEGPHLYVGTLMVLLLPQAFVGRGRRCRVVLGIAFLAMALYLFVPYARYFLNAFSGVYYKTSSFWISLIMAGTGALALDNLVRRRRINLWLLGITLAVCLVAMRLLLNSEFVLEWLRVKESYRVYRQVVVLLFVYSALLVILRFEKFRSIGLILIPMIVAWEVVQFAGGSVQDRLALRGDSAETGGYYFDDTLAAVRMIEQADQDFYRIEKGNVSVHLNDPIGQGYQGLSSYYSFNGGGYLAFLGDAGFDVDYKVPGHGSSYIIGPGDRTVLASLLSTKYWIVREWGNQNVPYGYSRWGRAGDALIYKNSYSVPFGAVYFEKIGEEAVRDLTPKTRDLIALAAAIVPSDTPVPDLGGIPKIGEERLREIVQQASEPDRSKTYERLATDLSGTAIQWAMISENRMKGTIQLDSPGLAYLSIPDNKGWSATVNGIATPTVPVHFGFKGLPLDAGKSEIVIEYFPPQMKAGMWISAATLLTILALSVPVIQFKHERVAR